MKTFYGGSFVEKEELSKAGIYHPIKLEYYCTKEREDLLFGENFVRYGVEVIKTEYLEDNVKVETVEVKDITEEEEDIHKILEILKENQVFPVTVEDVLEDLSKENLDMLLNQYSKQS